MSLKSELSKNMEDIKISILIDSFILELLKEIKINRLKEKKWVWKKQLSLFFRYSGGFVNKQKEVIFTNFENKADYFLKMKMRKKSILILYHFKSKVFLIIN